MWLTSLPLFASGFLIIVVPTALARAGTYWIRQRVTLVRLRMNNEVAGFKFSRDDLARHQSWLASSESTVGLPLITASACASACGNRLSA